MGAEPLLGGEPHQRPRLLLRPDRPRRRHRRDARLPRGDLRPGRRAASAPATSTTPSSWPTTPSTGSAPRSGRATSSGAKDIARRIEAGTVFVNGLVASDPRMPMGGVKRPATAASSAGTGSGSSRTSRPSASIPPRRPRLAPTIRRMTNGPIKLGANCWNQYTDWPAFREAGIRADRLGFDSLWTWDHLYPIVGDHNGPMFEGWLTLAAWAEATERATHRPHGRRQHVPQPGAGGEDGDDPRSHQRRAGGARHRRRLVRDRAPRLRVRVRRLARRAAALAGRGGADHARHARRRASRRARGTTRPTRSSTCRRRSSSACRSWSVAAARRRPCAPSPATPMPATSAAASRT